MKDIRTKYEKRYSQALVPLASRLNDHIADLFHDIPRIDRITVRAKGIESFLIKAEKVENGMQKYEDPLNQIQDQIGARIVTFYPDDVAAIDKNVKKYFRAIEDRTVVPDSDSEFGYFGKHYILLIPVDVINANEPEVKPFFELQIKTLFQHAWSEANHDLGYKSESDVDSHFRRRIAFTAAQAWGADQIFNDLYREMSSKPPKADS